MKDARWYNSQGRWFLFFFILLPSYFIIFLSSALAGPVNINTASEEELTTLPYIGTARAQAIVKYRRLHGPFRDIDTLLEVESIGPKSLEAVRPHITLANRPDAVSKVQTFVLGRGQTMLLADGHYFPVLINFIKSAGQRIELAMFLFKTTDSANNRPAQLVTELIRARKRGVQVQVVLEKSGYSDSINSENQRVAATLEKNNIDVRFDSPGKTTHTKMVIIDNRFCFVGSHNLSHSALTFNHEMSLLLDNHEMAEQLSTYIAAIK
ncbi:MAG: phospholipase D-like domain-containing protein [Thermodesulfobacteriota bacterium]